MTNRWREAVVPASTPLIDAIAALDATGLQILLVVDDDGRLAGTVTDGDVRRGILAKRPLDGPVADVMHVAPTTRPAGIGRDDARRAMRDATVRQLPLLDDEGRPAGLELLDNGGTPDRPNTVVIMAGGLGTRLRPLTEDTPKPLLRVGGRPLLETIIEAFAEYGFRKFHLSVNYRAAQVEEHFGDGRQLGVEIGYLREDEFLGTAGALSLLPHRPGEPVVVMNGDILTRVDFGQMLEFHERTGAEMTMCVREYDVEIPYGVVEVDGERVTSLVEKPTTRHFINAGIYVLAPELLATIRPGERLDMTDLADRISGRGGMISAFPIREYWLDIGHLEDFERAQAEFAQHFR